MIHIPDVEKMPIMATPVREAAVNASFKMTPEQFARRTEALIPLEFYAVVGTGDDQKQVRITRYNNHRRIWDDNGWAAVFRGEWYAFYNGEKWVWQYKSAQLFATPEDALAAAQMAVSDYVKESEKRPCAR